MVNNRYLKKAIIIVQWILTLLLICTMLFGLMALASSHKIPLKTTIAIGVTALALVALLFLAEFTKRKLR
jgi:hypothetical protein